MRSSTTINPAYVPRFPCVRVWAIRPDTFSTSSIRGCDDCASATSRPGAVDSSSLVSVDITSLIETRAGVRSGKPCFVGTRIAVYDVLECLASGMTTDEIVSDFPELTAQHVRAAIEFAALRERRLATA